MLVRAVEEPEVELKSNSADTECQTNADDFEQAKRVLKGLYPHRRFIEKVHNETHPSIATTWARVQRACNFPPGKKYQDAKDEVVRFCKSCIVCQKLKPARERLEQRAGSIKRRPFTEYAFDVIVLSEPDVNGNRYILTVIDSFTPRSTVVSLWEITGGVTCQLLGTPLHPDSQY
jgi:hypothetical protein